MADDADSTQDKNVAAASVTDEDTLRQLQDTYAKYSEFLLHPYTMPKEWSGAAIEQLHRLDPNGDKIATGPELAKAGLDMALDVSDMATAAGLSPEEAAGEIKKKHDLMAKAGGAVWAKQCVLENGTSKSFNEMTGLDKGALEGAYHDYWSREMLRENPLTRHLLFKEGEQQDLLRLPYEVGKALPEWVILPSGKEVCNALKDKVRELDPESPILAAEPGGKVAVDEALMRLLANAQAEQLANARKHKLPDVHHVPHDTPAPENGAIAPDDTPGAPLGRGQVRT